jgi:hypothetical protein
MPVFRGVPLVFAVACHAAAAPEAPIAPAGTSSPAAACAPALPVLAQQHAPNHTRIYVAPITVSPGGLEVGAPVLATSKQGYVNQPAFTADGSGLYFTWRPEGSQADIWLRDLRSADERPITCTSDEEYVGNLTPDRRGLSVVHIAPDLSRTLAVLGLDGAPQRTLFPSLTSIGAYRWADDHTVALLVSDSAGSKLLLGDVPSGSAVPVAEQVGAAIAAIPGARAISYLDNSGDHPVLMSLDLATRAATRLLALPDGVEHVAWLADRSVLVVAGTRILRASAAAPGWREVADLAGKIDGTLARIVVSDDQRRIALVTRLAS